MYLDAYNICILFRSRYTSNQTKINRQSVNVHVDNNRARRTPAFDWTRFADGDGVRTRVKNICRITDVRRRRRARENEASGLRRCGAIISSVGDIFDDPAESGRRVRTARESRRISLARNRIMAVALRFLRRLPTTSSGTNTFF